MAYIFHSASVSLRLPSRNSHTRNEYLLDVYDLEAVLCDLRLLTTQQPV